MKELFLFIFLTFLLNFNSAIQNGLKTQDLKDGLSELDKIALDNFKPIIAIISIPHKKNKNSVLSTDIVRFIEEGGARIIPIHYKTSWKIVKSILSKVNGVVFQGGGPKAWRQSEVPFHFNLQWRIFKWALQANQKGLHFPILGICLGYQRLYQFSSIWASGQSKLKVKTSDDVYNIRDKYFGTHKLDSEYYASNVEVLTNDSTLFASSYNLIKKFPLEDTKKLFFFNNKFGLNYVETLENEYFKKNWKMVAKTQDFGGQWFVAAIEHVKYPFYGLQMHPEKIQFGSFDHFDRIKRLKRLLYIPSNEEAIMVNSKISLNFVLQCKKNKNRFNDSNDYEPKLIDNYKTYIHIGGDVNSYYDIYEGFNKFEKMETVFPEMEINSKMERKKRFRN